MKIIPSSGLVRTLLLLFIGLGSLTAVIIWAAGVGDIPVTVSQTWRAILFGLGFSDSPLPVLEQGIVWEYRMSRLVMAALSGAGLATCGVILQALLRNPLAEPYLLGISAGASTGAVLIMLIGIGQGVVGVSGGAFVGACCAFVLITLLAKGLSGATERIILSGVAGTQLFNAITAYVVATSANAEQSRSVMFWLLGSMSSVRWPETNLAVTIIVPLFLVLLLFARRLDTLTLGDDIAHTLGTRITYLRVVLFLITALITAAIVSIIGAVGFVGLVIPHIARYLAGEQHLKLLPVAALTGAVFMVGADVVSRTLIEQQVLPIGVVTALVGAPAFAFILFQQKRSV